jgi:hypothetical protein
VCGRVKKVAGNVKPSDSIKIEHRRSCKNMRYLGSSNGDTVAKKRLDLEYYDDWIELKLQRYTRLKFDIWKYWLLLHSLFLNIELTCFDFTQSRYVRFKTLHTIGGHNMNI